MHEVIVRRTTADYSSLFWTDCRCEGVILFNVLDENDAVEVLVWIPATIIYGIYYFANDMDAINEKLIAYNVAILFAAIQVVVSFSCAFTNPINNN